MIKMIVQMYYKTFEIRYNNTTYKNDKFLKLASVRELENAVTRIKLSTRGSRFK